MNPEPTTGGLERQVLGLATAAFDAFSSGARAGSEPAKDFLGILLDQLGEGDSQSPQPGNPALEELLLLLRAMLCEQDPCPALLLIGHILEQLRGEAQAGSVYTPHWLASSMAGQLLQGWEPATGLPRIMDPACGCGAFLLCCAQDLFSRSVGTEQDVLLRRRIVETALHGCDSDETALWLCERLLAFWAEGSFRASIACGLEQADALGTAGPDGRVTDSFDMVICNPPYIDSEQMARSSPSSRRKIRERFSTARGNWDIYIPFVQLCVELLHEGGRMVVVVPSRVLCADYAAPLQELLLQGSLRHLRLLPLDSFPSARIWPVVIELDRLPPGGKHSVRATIEGGDRQVEVLQGQLQKLPPGYISAIFSRGSGYISELLSSCPSLSEYMHCSDGCTTSEAYEIARLLHDDPDAQRFRLLNTGTLDPFRCLWGKRSCRYLGRSYLHPALDGQSLSGRLSRRAQQAQSPKLVCAGLSPRLECFADTSGSYMCGKAAVQMLPRSEMTTEELHFYCGLLNSRLMQWLYRSLFGLRAYSSRALNIGPRQLELLPIRRGGQCPRIGELAMMLMEEPDDAGLLAELDCLVESLYKVDLHTRRVIEEELGPSL